MALYQILRTIWFSNNIMNGVCTMYNYYTCLTNPIREYAFHYHFIRKWTAMIFRESILKTKMFFKKFQIMGEMVLFGYRVRHVFWYFATVRLEFRLFKKVKLFCWKMSSDCVQRIEKNCDENDFFFQYFPIGVIDMSWSMHLPFWKSYLNYSFGTRFFFVNSFEVPDLAFVWCSDWDCKLEAGKTTTNEEIFF